MRLFLIAAAVLAGALSAQGQVIEFESGGLRYQTLTKNGVTVMFAHLPAGIRDYAVIQVAVSNGSPLTWTVKPEDFSFQRKDGLRISGTPARAVVTNFLEKGNRNDVVKLVNTYEQGLYGIPRFLSTNGYEARRQSFLAEVGSTRLKAGAAASAIAFVQTKLASGQSTDGAVFFETSGKPLGPGKIVSRVAGEVFEFDSLDPGSSTTAK
jgi:hypothetical protein